MEPKRYSQFGTFSMIVMVPIFAFCLIAMLTSGIRDAFAGIIIGFVSVIILVCLLIFYKITIQIDDKYLSFSLGIGLVKKRFPLSEISSCEPVRNSPWTGIGIRKIPNGWLYNVSGLDAIELKFKNRDSVLRIGTNDPVIISQEVNRLTDHEYYERAGLRQPVKAIT